MPSQSLSAPSFWAILWDIVSYFKGKLPSKKVRSYDISFKRKLQITEFSDFCIPWPSTTKFFSLHYDQTSDQGPIQHLHLSEGFDLT